MASTTGSAQGRIRACGVPAPVDGGGVGGVGVGGVGVDAVGVGGVGVGNAGADGAGVGGVDVDGVVSKTVSRSEVVRREAGAHRKVTGPPLRKPDPWGRRPGSVDRLEDGTLIG